MVRVRVLKIKVYFGAATAASGSGVLEGKLRRCIQDHFDNWGFCFEFFVSSGLPEYVGWQQQDFWLLQTYQQGMNWLTFFIYYSSPWCQLLFAGADLRKSNKE